MNKKKKVPKPNTRDIHEIYTHIFRLKLSETERKKKITKNWRNGKEHSMRRRKDEGRDGRCRWCDGEIKTTIR